MIHPGPSATLCCGGTFNPIHNGHLICARAAAESLGFNRVLLIPSANPPHKTNRPATLASAADRLKMCQLAIEGDPFFQVSDVEMRRPDPSYTLETARELKRGGIDPVFWLIGGDTLPQLPTWHQPAAVLREVQFVVMTRPGRLIDWPSLPPDYQVFKDQVVTVPLIEIEATEIRRRIHDGQGIEYLTPPAVVRYISEHRLYR